MLSITTKKFTFYWFVSCSYQSVKRKYIPRSCKLITCHVVFTTIHVGNSNITVHQPMSFSYSRGPRPKPLPEDRLSLPCSLALESIISSGPNKGQYLKLGYSLFTSCDNIRLHTNCDLNNHSEYVRTYMGLLHILCLM